jgi:hypothetical protein
MTKIKIAFWLDELNIRGTTVASYDYAVGNEEILQNESIFIVAEKGVTRSNPEAMVRIASRFLVYSCQNLDQMENILYEEKCSILYCIKYGRNDGIVSTRIKTVIHCVFDMSDPHGNVYAGVSEAVARKYGHSLFVPHMIALRPTKNGENLRQSLNIPPDAIVFGRYGGLDTFNIDFCWQVISDIVQRRTDIYFLFINTVEVVRNNRIFYLDKITTEEEKNRFISTCDAHLECGTLGHSFGLAIGEFSVHNKPIIAYRGKNMWNTAHFDILGNRGLYFSSSEQFFHLLTTFRRQNYENKDMNCYRDYTPEKVMAIFKKVFID